MSVPGDLVFHVNYLGGDEPVFRINFSRRAIMVGSGIYGLVGG
jgi:glutamate decarboxylase